MHRQPLLAALDAVERHWSPIPFAHRDAAEDAAVLQKLRGFVTSTTGCFDREQQDGHVTASALVVSPDLGSVLLTLHAKLGIWLQLGGHSDSHPRPADVAMREVEEESGLTRVRFLDYEELLPTWQDAPAERPLPFDLDWHVIPERKGEPAHIHYDIRFLIVADPTEPPQISPESRDLRWFTLAEARGVTSERSMSRQFDKLEWLAARRAALSARSGS
jgi:8-oxo-dGTP pyrophosphatase MutT (NUDIX family)